MIRSIFYVSDSTAMTAKYLGKSLLSQFEMASFKEYLRPYVDDESKVVELASELKAAKASDGKPPIVFASIMDEALMSFLSAHAECVIDIFKPFVKTLEEIIQEKPSKAIGRAHKAQDSAYQARVKAIDFALATDDGLRQSDYDEADVILIGVSRTGKTPTALYLALNFGLRVANFPFTSDDLPDFALSEALKKNRHKLIGLMIGEERLASIRKERRAHSRYADPSEVRRELFAMKELLARERIPYVDTTTRSVEEIAASIMTALRRAS